MGEILKIGKTLYEVDRRIKNYWYYARNPEKVSNEEEEQNKIPIYNARWSLPIIYITY